MDSQAGTCLLCNPNCLTCSGSLDTQCLTCPSTSYLDTNKCYPCDKSCKTCKQAGDSNCIDCNIGYLKSQSNICEKIPCEKSCRECTGTTGDDCYSCFPGFYLAFVSSKINNCVICSPTCLTCKDASYCLSCPSPLVLIDGKCLDKSKITPDDATTILGLNSYIVNSDASSVTNQRPSITSKINTFIQSQSSLTVSEAEAASNIILVLSTPDSSWKETAVLEMAKTSMVNCVTKIKIDPSTHELKTFTSNILDSAFNLKSVQKTISKIDEKSEKLFTDLINNVITNNFVYFFFFKIYRPLI